MVSTAGASGAGGRHSMITPMPSEQISVVTLERADTVEADMATLVIVGSRETRVITRPGKPPLVYTPRAAAEVSA